MARHFASVLNIPASAACDPARWAQAAYDVWEGSRLPASLVSKRAQQRFQALVAFAREASPFYRRHYRDLPAAPPIEAVPSVDKRSLMNAFDSVIAQGILDRREVDAFVGDPRQLGASLRGRYSVWTSSGTTGEPGLFVHDPDAIAIYDSLESQRFRGLRSPSDLARQMIEGDRYAMVAATGGQFAGIATVERMRRWLPWLAPSMRAFSLLQPIDELVRELNRFGPTLLATYPTAAEMLADEQQSGALQLSLRELWTGGEYLADSSRSRLQQIFGCRVRGAYGASEFLPIAWECPHRRLHVNSDWVLLEPVDRQGRAVPKGTRSSTVLLTNLANRIQPLIRYDLGDSVTEHVDACACGSAFGSITVEGRQDDALRFPLAAGGTTSVVPLALSTVLEDQASVHDFQVTQTAPCKLTVRLGAGETVASSVVRKTLGAYLGTLGVPSIEIAVAHRPPVRDRISGKLRRVICELPPSQLN